MVDTEGGSPGDFLCVKFVMLWDEISVFGRWRISNPTLKSLDATSVDQAMHMTDPLMEEDTVSPSSLLE